MDKLFYIFQTKIKLVAEWPLYTLYYQEQFPSEIKILYVVFSLFYDLLYRKYVICISE